MTLVNHPVLCNYYLTYRCNASCSFCDIWEKPSGYVTLDNVRANLVDLKRLGISVIDFTGGEPLLHRQLPAFLAIAKDLGFITTVTTNCLLYPKYAESLVGLVDMLHFSVDAATAEAHNSSRNVNCFGHVMQSIEIGKTLGERPDILFTVTPNNLAELEAIYNKISQPNGLILIINPIFNYAGIDAFEDFTAAQLKLLRQWGRRKGVYLNAAFIAFRGAGGNQVTKPVCKAGSTTVVIDPQNQLVLPCYHLGIDSIAIDGNLFGLWHSDKIQRLIAKEGRYDACQGCTINCYMQPSFATSLNKYWLLALPSTIKYNYLKGTWKALIWKKKRVVKTSDIS